MTMHKLMSPLVSALALAVCVESAGLAAGTAGASPDGFRFSIGPNLFVDDYLVEQSIGLTRRTHQPVKLPRPALGKAEAWHTQVQWALDVDRDPQTGLFKAWYNVRNPDGQPGVVFACAESRDGISWDRPYLGLLEVGGTRRNNLIDAPLGRFGMFLVDDRMRDPDPSRRFKLAYFSSGLAAAFSPDGLHFTPYNGNPLLPTEYDESPPVPTGLGTVISDIVDGCWDPIKREFLLGCKAVRNGYPGKPAYNAEGYRRCVAMSASRDFIHWYRPRVIVTPDPNNGLEEFYGFEPMVRGNLYLGFIRVLRDDLSPDSTGPPLGIGWTEMITSRDGRNWTRYQEKFIDRNPNSGTWDHAIAWFADCVTVGDRDYVYYGGYSQGHKVGDRQVGLAILRKNGFVSRDAGSKGGALRTPLAQLPGDLMTVNAAVRGELKVRVINGKGRAISGYGWSDCEPIRGDSVAHPVKWKGGSALPRFERVSLEFSLRDAELYGFDLNNTMPWDDLGR